MTTYVVKSRPVRPITAEEVKEAARALAHQGHPSIEADRIVDALWMARTLPTALDVVFDIRCITGGYRLRPLRVERRKRNAEGPLSALSLYALGDEIVTVHVGPKNRIQDPPAHLSAALSTVHFVREKVSGNDDAPVVTRFSL